MAERHLHDPYAARRPAFPRDRLRRAGLSADAMDHLNDRFDDMGEEQATRWARQIRQQSGTHLRRRFTVPDDPADLAGYTHTELRDLAAAEGVTLSGTNEDLRARITGDQPPEPAEGPGPVAEPVPGDSGEPAVTLPPPPAPEPSTAAPDDSAAPTSAEPPPDAAVPPVNAAGEDGAQDTPPPAQDAQDAPQEAPGPEAPADPPQADTAPPAAGDVSAEVEGDTTADRSRQAEASAPAETPTGQPTEQPPEQALEQAPPTEELPAQPPAPTVVRGRAARHRSGR